MMVHPSPFADYPALGVPCGNKGFRRARRPTAEHYARCLVHIADWQPRSQRMISIVSASLTRARSKTQTLWQRRTAVASGRDGLLSSPLPSPPNEERETESSAVGSVQIRPARRGWRPGS
jgi:hypothetical protein